MRVCVLACSQLRWQCGAARPSLRWRPRCDAEHIGQRNEDAIANTLFSFAVFVFFELRSPGAGLPRRARTCHSAGEKRVERRSVSRGSCAHAHAHAATGMPATNGRRQASVAVGGPRCQAQLFEIAPEVARRTEEMGETRAERESDRRNLPPPPPIFDVCMCLHP